MKCDLCGKEDITGMWVEAPNTKVVVHVCRTCSLQVRNDAIKKVRKG